MSTLRFSADCVTASNATGGGIERLPAGHRKDLLRDAADDILGTFSDRVPFDAVAAGRYARIVDRRERSGRPVDGFDAQIASICAVHRATLATRNTTDFEDTGIDLVNPWQSTEPTS